MTTLLYHSKDGYDMNASLVCAGCACWSEKHAPDDKRLENCQKEAREVDKGLWANDDPNPALDDSRKVVDTHLD